MIKLTGIKNGAVLQRDDNNVCRCYFQAESVGTLRVDMGQVTNLSNNQYVLTGIPVGGPYDIILLDEESEVQLHDIYVGDVWILAGQSNMEGAGKMRQSQYELEQNPISTIRAYYMNEKWGIAKPQLHQLWESIDSCIREPFVEYRLNSPWKTAHPDKQVDGVGPGMYFAMEMQRRNNGVPQGVIPCGVGGSNLDQWKPNTTDNLYAAMKRRFHECGANVRGVFWYQGESQAHMSGVVNFVSDMQNLVESIRKDFRNVELPFVQVQINCYRGGNQDGDICWTKIRELQRTLDEHIEHLTTVYSVDCGLDDLIHLSSQSQEKIGARAAEAMHYAPFRANIKIHYSNIVGGLTSQGVPFGFSILEKEDGEPIREIARIDLEGDSLRLVVELDPAKMEDYYVCYGYGNTYYCNITDEAGRSIPAMGPLRIKDYL